MANPFQRRNPWPFAELRQIPGSSVSVATDLAKTEFEKGQQVGWKQQRRHLTTYVISNPIIQNNEMLTTLLKKERETRKTPWRVQKFFPCSQLPMDQ
jgi:hypothetical protein